MRQLPRPRWLPDIPIYCGGTEFEIDFAHFFNSHARHKSISMAPNGAACGLQSSATNYRHIIIWYVNAGSLSQRHAYTHAPSPTGARYACVLRSPGHVLILSPSTGSLTSYANIVLGRVTDLDCGYCFFTHMDIDLFDKLGTQPFEINIHDPDTKVRSVNFRYTPHVAIKKHNGHLMAFTST